MDPTILVASGSAWAWNKYGRALTDLADGAIKVRWEKFKWQKAAEKYCTRVKSMHGSMQIMGMAEPVPLDDIFTDVYMLDRPTAFGRFDIEHLKQLSNDPAEPPPSTKRINGLKLTRDKGNLFILGKPGAGKTTFLKYLALQAAEQNIDKIPLFISLKEWADSSLELIAFISRQFDICDFPSSYGFVEELLKSTNAIVLFDGLDEVNQETGQRDRQTREMVDFIRKYEKTQCLITCRIAANDYSFQPFTYVEMADFTENQIQSFVGKWFRNKSGEKDEDTCKKFLAEFRRDDNKGLRDLARTPLLLTLLCLAFNETLMFPQRRVEIYEEALNALLKKWDASRRIRRDDAYRKLSLGHKENMLARIAAATFEENKYFVRQSELERLILNYVADVPPHETNEATDGEAILKAIEVQHGIFVERAHAVYSFSHLTFQEYFTAKYVVANSSKSALIRLIKAHCGDKRWREVFLLTTSLLLDASEFITLFRTVVDEDLGRDQVLSGLVSWADKKSSSTKTNDWLVRKSYLVLGFMISSDPAIAPKLNYDPEIGIDPDLDLDITLVRVCTLAHLHAYSHASEDSFARALSAVYIDALSYAHKLRLTPLCNALSKIQVLNKAASMNESLQYKQLFLKTIISFRNIGHQLNLLSHQIERLLNYFTAVDLLRDCLELATMPPLQKKAIEQSLYLPSKHG